MRFVRDTYSNSLALVLLGAQPSVNFDLEECTHASSTSSHCYIANLVWRKLQNSKMFRSVQFGAPSFLRLFSKGLDKQRDENGSSARFFWKRIHNKFKYYKGHWSGQHVPTLSCTIWLTAILCLTFNDTCILSLIIIFISSFTLGRELNDPVIMRRAKASRWMSPHRVLIYASPGVSLIITCHLY